MEAFYQRLSERAATLDELLSDAFEASAKTATEKDLSGERIAAWRRSCAAGDPSLFARRLTRDGLSWIEIENRLAGARRRACAPHPQWLEDAVWVEQTFADPIALLRLSMRATHRPIEPMQRFLGLHNGFLAAGAERPRAPLFGAVRASHPAITM